MINGAGSLYVIHFGVSVLLILDVLIQPVQLCTRTATLPETTGALFTPTEASTTASITPVTEKTVRTTSTVKTTTTPITECSSAEPLFKTGIAVAGDEVIEFLPDSTAPVGQQITANCVGAAPGVTDTKIYVTFDSLIPSYKQDEDNVGGQFEQITLTCTPSGLWKVTLITTNGPVSDIVSNPKNIRCSTI